MDGHSVSVLHTDNTTLYCTIHEGRVFLEYFTMADPYCTYRVGLDYDALCKICKFLDNWKSEQVTIIQPYSTTVNTHPMFCAVRFEYVKNENKKCPRDRLQRVTFYAQCWDEDIESSVENEKILSWSYWDDYYNWEGFEKLRKFLHNVKELLDNFKGETE